MRPLCITPQAASLGRPAALCSAFPNATRAASWHRRSCMPLDARLQTRTRAAKKEEPGAAVEEPSTSGRAEPEAAAPAETVEDVAKIVKTAAPAQPAKRQDSAILSEEDIRRLATQRREQGRGRDIGFIDGIKEEVQLIEWPKPSQAIADTVVVIAIVGSLAAFLFAVNALLAEGSRRFYDLPISLDRSIAEQLWDNFTK